MTLEEIAEDVHREFVRNGYLWKIDGEWINPTLQDVKDMLDKMRDTLYAQKEDSQLEVGRLIAKKHPDGIDVYLFMGEF